MKPEEMDQQKLVGWMREYLKKSKDRILDDRSKLYDAIAAEDNDTADVLLRELVLKQAIHSMLLEEIMDYEEYMKMMEAMQKAVNKDKPAQA